jgi:phosphatidylserine/phosphatidylglycerophosphate/cardiolipin synthase-like enzyme
MHAKLVVADDVVFLGSFNLSRSGERNAEAVLEIHDPALADRLADFVESVAARYPRVTVPEAPPPGGRPMRAPRGKAPSHG